MKIYSETENKATSTLIQIIFLESPPPGGDISTYVNFFLCIEPTAPMKTNNCHYVAFTAILMIKKIMTEG
jgi:hypothetical protein